MSITTVTKREGINYISFYKKLPPKTCVDCGHEVIEQHESYLTKCEHCLRKEID